MTVISGQEAALARIGPLINSLTDTAERVKPPSATFAPVQEVPDGLFDQFIAALIPAGG